MNKIKKHHKERGENRQTNRVFPNKRLLIDFNRSDNGVGNIDLHGYTPKNIELISKDKIEEIIRTYFKNYQVGGLF